MFPVTTKDSGFPASCVQTVTTSPAATGKATVAVYGVLPLQPPLEPSQSGPYFLQQRSVSSIQLSTSRMNQLPVGSPGLESPLSRHLQCLQETVDQLCKHASITVKGNGGFYDQISAIFKEIATSRAKVKELNGKVSQLNSRYEKTYNQLIKDASELQKLKEKLEDTTTSYNDSKKSTEKVIGQLQEITDNFKKAVYELKLSQGKVEAAEKEIQELKKQNVDLKRDYELSQIGAVAAEGTILKLQDQKKELNIKYEQSQSEVVEVKSINQELETRNKKLKIDCEQSQNELDEEICRVSYLKSEVSSLQKLIVELKEKPKKENCPLSLE